MSALSLRIPDELEVRLDTEARRAGVPRSEIARTALEDFLARRERERFLAAFVAEARATYGDAVTRDEMLALADEALPHDNAALEIAEAGQSRRRKTGRNARRKAGA
jgi:predicted transcriptional regulator